MEKADPAAGTRRTSGIGAALKIAVPFDFDEDFGYFLKADLVDRLHSLKVEIIPLFHSENCLLHHLDEAQGLLIPGGLSDVDPNAYKESEVHKKTKVCKTRTDFEYEVLNRFIKTKKPILALCWGLQLVNVYYGGSLHQHLPDHFPSDIFHEQTEAKHLPTHWVEFVKGGTAAKLFGAEKLFVNSTHHQGIKTLGKNLSIEGKSEDGLVECFSVNGHPFFWAVQWHPERLKDDPIIPAFLKACRHPH